MSNESGFKRVARDVTDLFELQMQLFAVDSQEAMRKAVKAVVLIGIAAAVTLATMTTLVMAAGWGLHEYSGWPLSLSLLSAGIGGLVISGLIAFVGVVALRRALALIAEPKRELTENLKWLKATILAPSTSPRNQLRRESFRTRFQVSAEN